MYTLKYSNKKSRCKKLKNYNSDTLNNYYNVYTLFNIYNNTKDYKKIICDTLNYSIENTLKEFKEEISTDLDNTVKYIEDSILDYEDSILDYEDSILDYEIIY